MSRGSLAPAPQSCRCLLAAVDFDPRSCPEPRIDVEASRDAGPLERPSLHAAPNRGSDRSKGAGRVSSRCTVIGPPIPGPAPPTSLALAPGVTANKVDPVRPPGKAGSPNGTRGSPVAPSAPIQHN